MKIAGKIILALLLISSTLLSTNCYADFIAEGCADSYNLAARDDPKAWNDRCQDLHMQKTFGNRWKEVKDFYFKLKRAIANNDKKAILKMIKNPFLVYDNISEQKNEAEVLREYNTIFDEETKEMVLESAYRRLYIHGSSVIIFYEFGDPFVGDSLDFGINCLDPEKDIKTCKPYNIKLLSLIKK